MVRATIQQCKALKIDVAQFDPLISFHKIRENVSEDMDVLVKEAFGVVAAEANVAIDLSQHVRKPALGQEASTVEDARGSGALIFACRIARTLNFMTTTEAAKLNIAEERRRSYLRIDDGKGNPKPLGKATWMEIVPEDLANGEQVATLKNWAPPSVMADLPADAWRKVCELVRTGEYRCDNRSPEWLGWKVAKLFDIDIAFGETNEEHCGFR
jgi:hypothetical protein